MVAIKTQISWNIQPIFPTYKWTFQSGGRRGGGGCCFDASWSGFVIVSHWSKEEEEEEEEEFQVPEESDPATGVFLKHGGKK